jgi:hypothetical protein
MVFRENVIPIKKEQFKGNMYSGHRNNNRTTDSQSI